MTDRSARGRAMSRPLRLAVGSSLAFVCLAASLAAASVSDNDLERAAARITAASAFRTVETLAAPGMRGRLSGTEGYRRAADWVISEVRRAGLLAPEEFPGFRQPFTHGLGGVESASLTVLPSEGEKDGRPAEAVLLSDFAPMVNGGSGDVTADVVFVGFGFNAPGQGRDDYAGVDVKGKVVLALRGEPEKGEWKDHRSSAARTLAAARMGAAAFFLVDDAVTSTSLGVSRDLPEAMLSEAFADRLLAGQKLTVAELRKVMVKGGTASFATGRRVRFAVKGLHWREVTTHNVVAVLPGADPALRGEYVVVGSHLDHIGDWPRLNPGADDNASGSAAVLLAA
ncbi:M28 family peptidase, partial [bacterium]|nr:M28 family peptidase [bacterium]